MEADNVKLHPAMRVVYVEEYIFVGIDMSFVGNDDFWV
jgi:hypothetical protein